MNHQKRLFKNKENTSREVQAQCVRLAIPQFGIRIIRLNEFLGDCFTNLNLIA